MINKIIEFAIKNRMLVIIAAILLVAAGIKCFLDLPVDVYPDLNAPVVNVITENPGMAPEDMESLITFPLESSFNSLPYVKRVSSNSTLGLSKISIEFEYGTDIYFARQLVTEKLELAGSTLPQDIDPPFIGPISSMFADAIEFTIRGDDLTAVRDFAEWNLKPRLQTVPGVSNVINLGGYLKQFHVILDPNRLLAYSIKPSEVVKALAENNLNSSGGFIEEGPEERIIKGMGRIRGIKDINDIVLRTVQGAPVTIRDVAEVKVGSFVRRGSAGVSGHEVVIVTVQNQYNANVMKTIKGVEAVLREVKKHLPDGWSIQPFYNQLDIITKSISNVEGAIYIGALLVIFILYVFMNSVRSTLIVAMAIPLSGVFAFIFFRIFHLTINMMTLGGLAIGLGMIVDSSIIMAENIFRHLNTTNESFTQAIINGAREVGNPIFYAVLILLSVFAPIFTLQGLEGKMFIPLTFAVFAAVLGSLIISLTITPVLASLFFKKDKKNHDNFLLRGLKRIYEPFLIKVLDHAWKALIISLIFLAAGITGYFFVGSEFMPEMDESSLLVDVLLPPETSLNESARIASLVGQKIAQIPEVLEVVRATGKARGAEHTAPINLTHANCVLVPKEKRKKSIEEIKNEIRSLTSDIPGVNIQINAPLQHRINHVVTGIRADIAVKLFGENMSTILALCDKIRDAMSQVAGVADLQIEQLSGVPQYQVKLNRDKLARYGLNVKDVSDYIEIALNGTVATELIEAQKRYDIFVRFREESRDERKDINNLILETSQGYRIPLNEVAQVVEVTDPMLIRRENALRRGVVQCNVSGRDMGSVVRAIKEQLKNIELPEGYFITFGGTYENQIRAMKQLSIVVFLTIIIVFCLLIVSFGSLREAMLIIYNIPLALSGGILILLITGHTLSVPSIVGFIALIGIAVQDGVVLVNHIKGYRKKGLPVREAVIIASNNKLRPVLMTSFTTLLGLIPLVMRNLTGSEIQKPLAFVIMFGLLFSTMLTLLVLPALYTVMEKGHSRSGG